MASLTVAQLLLLPLLLLLLRLLLRLLLLMLTLLLLVLLLLLLLLLALLLLVLLRPVLLCSRCCALVCPWAVGTHPFGRRGSKTWLITGGSGSSGGTHIPEQLES